MYDRLLVLTDGSDGTAAVADHAVELADGKGVTLADGKGVTADTLVAGARDRRARRRVETLTAAAVQKRS